MSRTELSGIEAQLFVADIAAACDFYAGKLGFEIAFTYGKPPFYGQVRRGAARLNLRLVCEPVCVGDFRERESLLSASITLGGAAALKTLYDEFPAAGAAFNQTPRQQPWGVRDFVVRDPDGNLLLFAAQA